jgi:hypothetical protein
MYAFYSRLYSVREALCRFVDALGDVLQKYRGRSTRRTGSGAYKKAFSLINYLEPGLSVDFEDAFAEESFVLRTEEVHFWGFPIIDGKIPTPLFLATWLNTGLRQQGLAALSAFLKSGDRDSVFKDPNNFIDPVQQARIDLNRFETLIDNVWKVALRELGNLKDLNGYYAAQNAGKGDPPPTRTSVAVSSLTEPSSGRA